VVAQPESHGGEAGPGTGVQVGDDLSHLVADDIDGQDQLEAAGGQVLGDAGPEGALVPPEAPGPGDARRLVDQRDSGPDGEGPVELLVGGPPEPGTHGQGGSAHRPPAGAFLAPALDEDDAAVDADSQQVDRRRGADAEVGRHRQFPGTGAGQQRRRLHEQRLQRPLVVQRRLQRVPRLAWAADEHANLRRVRPRAPSRLGGGNASHPL
jgi:hypothetical protein